MELRDDMLMVSASEMAGRSLSGPLLLLHMGRGEVRECPRVELPGTA